jgi:hypothetical protein
MWNYKGEKTALKKKIQMLLIHDFLKKNVPPKAGHSFFLFMAQRENIPLPKK